MAVAAPEILSNQSGVGIRRLVIGIRPAGWPQAPGLKPQAPFGWAGGSGFAAPQLRRDKSSIEHRASSIQHRD